MNKKLVYTTYIVFWSTVAFFVAWLISDDTRVALAIAIGFLCVLFIDWMWHNDRVYDAYRRRSHRHTPGYVPYHSYRWWGRRG